MTAKTRKRPTATATPTLAETYTEEQIADRMRAALTAKGYEVMAAGLNPQTHRWSAKFGPRSLFTFWDTISGDSPEVALRNIAALDRAPVFDAWTRLSLLLGPQRSEYHEEADRAAYGDEALCGECGEALYR